MSGDSGFDTERRDRCTNCGDAIETTDWHPVQTVQDSDSITVYTFCSDACRAEWSP